VASGTRQVRLIDDGQLDDRRRKTRRFPVKCQAGAGFVRRIQVPLGVPVERSSYWGLYSSFGRAVSGKLGHREARPSARRAIGKLSVDKVVDSSAAHWMAYAEGPVVVGGQ
jgi:hypothetical protein